MFVWSSDTFYSDVEARTRADVPLDEELLWSLQYFQCRFDGNFEYSFDFVRRVDFCIQKQRENARQGLDKTLFVGFLSN